MENDNQEFKKINSINGIDIFIKKGIKYRKTPKGKFLKICEFEGCSKYIDKNAGSNNCLSHKGNTDPNSPKRIELKKESEKKRMAIINSKRIIIERDYENKIVIDNIEILIVNGKKYRKKLTGKYDKVCMFDNCTKFSKSEKETGEQYCLTHINGTHPNSNERLKLKINRKKELKDEHKLNRQIDLGNLEKIIIQGEEIFIKDNIKYKLRKSGKTKDKLSRVCNYDNCNKLVQISIAGEFCRNHINGTDPFSDERINKKENKINELKIKNKSNILKGDKIENWLCEIIKIFSNIETVERIGFTGNKFDIKYKFRNENKERGLQVKTLSKGYTEDAWFFSTNKSKYDDDNLIVGINEYLNRFVLAFPNEILKGKTIFSFMSGGSIYNKNMFTNITSFLNKLKILMEKSTIYNIQTALTEAQKKEFYSMERLENKCNELKYSFKRNDTINSIDCFINIYNIQCKFSSVIKFNKCYISLSKCDGTYNKKHKRRPYDIKDNIDFFIFEILNKENNFYIIPIKIMIQKGFISTKDQIGKMKISIDLYNRDWISTYLNGFDLLKSFLK